MAARKHSISCRKWRHKRTDDRRRRHSLQVRRTCATYEQSQLLWIAAPETRTLEARRLSQCGQTRRIFVSVKDGFSLWSFRTSSSPTERFRAAGIWLPRFLSSSKSAAAMKPYTGHELDRVCREVPERAQYFTAATHGLFSILAFFLAPCSIQVSIAIVEPDMWHYAM